MSRAIAIAVANQKGGVGKTTTSVNLAASLATAERRTLLVDTDPQANATSGVGARRDAPGLYDALAGRASMDEVIQKTDVPMLDVAPSSADLVGIELELIDAEDRALRVREVLEPVRERYRYIVLDCPPSLGLLTINALSAADQVLVPMQCEYYALEGLTQLMATVERVRGAYNPTLTVVGIVLTMYDSRNSLTHQVADEVRGHFHVFDAIIPRNVKLSEAPSYGKPALLYDIQCKGAQGYLSLAHELVARQRKMSAQAPGSRGATRSHSEA